MLSFDKRMFLSKAELMYKRKNSFNLAPAYLNSMFWMRDITLDNTAIENKGKKYAKTRNRSNQNRNPALKTKTGNN